MTLVNGGTRVLYHIGKRPAKPEHHRLDMEKGWSYRRHGYVPAAHEKVVFLSPNPLAVSWLHAIRHTKAHVYAYEVPIWVIKELGGINEIDQAPELAVPERLWPYVRFLGRSETDTVAFHARASRVRTSRASWDYRRFPRETQEVRRQLWWVSMKALGLNAVPDPRWVRNSSSQYFNDPRSWRRELTVFLRRRFPVECQQVLLRAGQGGREYVPGSPAAAERYRARARATLLAAVRQGTRTASQEDRLRDLLMPPEESEPLFKRLDALFLRDSRHPRRKPPVRG